ncbi:PspA/IM30 family protein [Effusibacillus dendaii]|uniref:Protein LiaH n=1 Tax=Effusibacillus dendaii TaxID=2743772 RepID=A0A7I8DA30_9BACL|nr:PspA/IM30 family protein [Effusibacillus dendaii]BCJ85380.1 protein LiaH [Effusibacillus dendaii]
MGILKRVRDLVSANLHEAFDQLENPVVMIKHYIRDLEKEIDHAETVLARQEAAEQMFTRLVTETEARVEKRLRQAKLAVETGEEDMAKLALADKLEAEAKLAEYRQQVDVIREQTLRLRGQLEELWAKYQELESRKVYLVSRAAAAQSIRQMNCVMDTVDTKSAVKGFERMEERVRMMELQASIRTGRARKTGLVSQVGERELQERLQIELEKLKAESR